MAKGKEKSTFHGRRSTSNPANPALEGQGTATGRNYPASHFNNPWNNGLEHYVGGMEGKTLYSPSSVVEGEDIPLHEGRYNSLWEKGS